MSGLARRSLYSVLRQKEEQLARVRREIEALKALVYVISLREDHETSSVRVGDALKMLYDLLEAHAPTWYTEEHHDKAEAALRSVKLI